VTRVSDPETRESMPGGLRGMVLVVAFLCELAMLVTLCVAGTGLGSSTGGHVALAVVLPVVAAVIWSVWMAPSSRRRLADPARLIAQIALFGLTGVLAAVAGRVAWGVAFAVVAIVVFVLTRAFD
jgi:hypothetical protein